jgi:hypothetical protein
MVILAIDPGPEKSGVTVYDAKRQCIRNAAVMTNHDLTSKIRLGEIRADMLAIEMVACYGMAVGEETFETCLWIGRFIEAWEHDTGGVAHKTYRKDVKLYLCNSLRAKDANVRQALIDMFGGSSAIGSKKQPGPLYGIKSHMWSALAVAVTAAHQLKEAAK